MASRGLELREAKTRITRGGEGLDFLGFNVRRHHGKLLTRPAKGKVMGYLWSVEVVPGSCQQNTGSSTRQGPQSRRSGVGERRPACRHQGDTSKVDYWTWHMVWGWVQVATLRQARQERRATLRPQGWPLDLR